MVDPDRRAAFEGLLDRYLAALRRLAWAYARDGFDDLLQEIAMALWTALPRFRGDSTERTWVYQVAHNTAISFVARQRRRERREQTGALPVDIASSRDLEHDALDKERRQRLWKAVQGLREADRQIVLLYLEGLPAVDISAVTGITPGAVATRLTRARQRLMAQIKSEDGLL